MPGRRLTERDRSHIETALAAGVRVAEIGRRLGRPTSTISREVARNGGPGRYRAAHAQRAAEWRAHRRSATAPESTRDADGLREFVAEFVTVIVRTGLPPMAARVLARLLVTDTGTLTAAELAAQLRVSRASVSKAVRYLETLAVLRREQPAGRRRERYVLGEDLWHHAWVDNTRTNTMWADTARRGSALLGPATPAGARLHDLAVFFTDLNVHMGHSPAWSALADATTIAAALTHAGARLTPRQLATALGWPAARVHRALRTAADHPSATGPLTVVRDGEGRLTVTPAARLNDSQLAALRAAAGTAPRR